VRSPAVIVIGEVAGLVLDAPPATSAGAGDGSGGGAEPDVPGAVEQPEAEPSRVERSRGEPAGAEPGTPAD
jgi:hypothetical protein